jgi:uncharacterized protein YgiM (DUF1202 family)
VRKWIAAAATLFAACASTTTVETPPPAPAPPPVSRPAEDAVIGAARVTTNSLNVRSAPSLEGEILVQVKKNDRLSILQSGEDWIRVRLADGTTGWVSRALIAIDGQSSSKVTAGRPRRAGCPPDSDFHFARTPMVAMTESPKHGLVVVEAYVNVNGDVTSTKVVNNTTGDETLALVVQKEMKSAKFVPPVRACVVREFIYTYRRTF